MGRENSLVDPDREALYQDFLGGRITRLNTMLRGIGVTANERYGNYNFLEESKGLEQHVYTRLTLTQNLSGLSFMQIWNNVLAKRLISSSTDKFYTLNPRALSISQRIALDSVGVWVDLEDPQKSVSEIASCNAFLAVGNSFPWEKDPELLAEVTNDVILIGMAHNALRSK